MMVISFNMKAYYQPDLIIPIGKDIDMRMGVQRDILSIAVEFLRDSLLK
jgi:hypothetical protein